MDRAQPPAVGSAPRAVAPDLADALRMGQQVGATRDRWRAAEVRDRWSLRIGAAAFVAAATGLSLVTDWSTLRPGVFVLAIAALAVASAVELEVGTASAVPTEPLVIAMLLLLPPGAVPWAVVLAMVAGNLHARARGMRRESVAVAATSSAFVIGPAIAVHVLGLGPIGPRWWAVIAVAFAAQVASDLVISWWRNCVGLGVGFGELVAMLRWSYTVDLLLVPVGVTAVMATDASPASLLVALCPAGLMAFLARDRAAQMDTLISLGTAYSDASGQARRDALTGLGNRLAWDEAVAADAATGRGTAGVLMLDVDHLKEINDAHGHEVGDRLLVSVSDVLRDVVASRGLTCRIGGDEFGILLMDADGTEVEQVGRAIELGLAQAAPVGDHPISASVGFAAAPPGQLHRAVRDADRAMYRTKQARRAGRATSVIHIAERLERAI